MSHETEWFWGRSLDAHDKEDLPMKRMTVIPWLLWAFVIALAIYGVIHATKSHAALNYQAQGPDGQVAGLRLSEAPCTNEKVREALKAHIKPEYQAKFKAAVLTWKGRDWHSCWLQIEVVDQNGREHEMIWSVDEEGVPFNPPYGIPKRMFREDSI